MANDGKLRCGKCGNLAVPMKGGKGFRCGAPGNRWDGKQWSKCDWSQFNRSERFSKRTPTPRAESWPVIKTPTDEQGDIRTFLGLAPAARGGRCLIVDAGPGTAKTTTLSWSCQSIYNRLGNVQGYPFCCFNVNASLVATSKLPPEWSDVSTLNSWGAKAQGYTMRSYDKGKSFRHFKASVAHLPEKERPNFGKLGKVLEKSRVLGLWADVDDTAGWGDIFATVLQRFPDVAKKVKGQEKVIGEYLPTVAAACLHDDALIDIQEQVTRPLSVTLAKLPKGQRIPCSLSVKPAAEWTDEDVQLVCNIIRRIDLPQCRGMIVDEAQDMNLCQLCVVMAQCWRTGELTLIGDDAKGTPGTPEYKAGQGIFGWNGAFRGVLTLAARLWEVLTGETVTLRNLTVTFRHGPEICDSYRPLNGVITSAKPEGQSLAFCVGAQAAFEAWLSVPEGKTGLYITRTNAALVPWFLATIEAHEECTLRGGNDFSGSIDTALYESAGWYGDDGEYKVDLPTAMSNLARIIAEQQDEGQQEDPNSLEGFVLRIAEALVREPQLLRKADLPVVLSVGNVRRFILHFADKAARRVCSTVYRSKGDEAHTSIVGDVGKFNEAWGDGGDDACRHVAASRGIDLSLTIGHLHGTTHRPLPDDVDLCDFLAGE